MSRTPLYTSLLLGCLLASAAAVTPAHDDWEARTARRSADVVHRSVSTASHDRRLQGAYQQVDGRWGGRFNKPVDATLSARDNVQAGRRPGDRENRRKLQATYTPAQLDKKASKAPVELRVSARSQDFGVRPRDELNDRRLQATYTEASARAPADARVTDSYNAPVDARVALRDTELGARLRDETKGGRKLQAPKKKGKDCTDAVACTGRKMLGYPGIHVLGRRDGRYAEDVAAVRAREKAQP